MNSATLTTGPNLEIRNCVEKREEWLARLPDSGTVTLDAGPLQSIDTAGVQMIIALHRECRARGLTLHLPHDHPVLTSACSILGIADWRS